MTGKLALTSAQAPAPAGGYSQAVVAGPFVYTAGMGPVDPATGKIVGEDVGTQTHQVLRNLTAILAEADATLDDVVKVTVHLQDLHRDFAGFDAAYREALADAGPLPVRTTVGSDLAGILVEIDVVAYRG